ncbi:MAG: SAM-dependent methyltransferase [Thermomicrobiales bacterium]|nr:MAG: SAM-dependent methyltransferase [Thermomicrobiales bacterium]
MDSSLDRIQRIYDRLAPEYDRVVGRGERFLVGDFRQKFGAALRGDTLEIAIGSGLNLPYYTPAVRRAVGIDLSLGMLRQARVRAAELGLPIALIQMDAEHLGFRDHSFDTVAISLALCTIPDPEAALREAIRVCRPDGQIVLLEHVRSPVWPVALLQRLWTPIQERTLGCHLMRTTIDTARNLGLTIESEHERFFGIFRLAIARPPDLK